MCTFSAQFPSSCYKMAFNRRSKTMKNEMRKEVTDLFWIEMLLSLDKYTYISHQTHYHTLHFKEWERTNTSFDLKKESSMQMWKHFVSWQFSGGWAPFAWLQPCFRSQSPRRARWPRQRLQGTAALGVVFTALLSAECVTHGFCVVMWLLCISHFRSLYFEAGTWEWCIASNLSVMLHTLNASKTFHCHAIDPGVDCSSICFKKYIVFSFSLL